MPLRRSLRETRYHLMPLSLDSNLRLRVLICPGQIFQTQPDRVWRTVNGGGALDIGNLAIAIGVVIWCNSAAVIASISALGEFSSGMGRVTHI